MPAIHLDQALNILRNAVPVQVSRTGGQVSTVEAMGCVAAECVTAAVDHPPAAQSLRDGVAYAGPPTSDVIQRWGDLHIDVGLHVGFENIRELVGEVFPGDPTPSPLLPGQAVRIMTGATVPAGASGVVMIEEVEWLSPRDQQNQSATSVATWSSAQVASHVRLPARRLQKFVLDQGAIFRQGDELIRKGTRINPIHVGLLSSTGRDAITCLIPTKVAILTTGDELIAPGHALRVGQIYNSNGPLLQALLAQAGPHEVTVAHAGDSERHISAWLEQNLGHVDLILTTGAVSAGQKDQLPELFQRHGVQTLFHGVNIKPGKPIFCGRFEPGTVSVPANALRNTMVLGLPGNPISVWVTFQLFARPLLEWLCGSPREQRWISARLAKSGNFQDSRLTFWPGRLQWNSPPWDRTESNATREPDATPVQNEPWVLPLDWQGSPDLRSPTEANCLIYFANSSPAPSAESLVNVLLLPEI